MDTKSYLTFTAGFPQDKARERFIQKYGKEPKQVFIVGDYLKLGPVPKQEKNETR